MAKLRINDFDTTASNNTDVGGVGIQGTNSPRNLDDALRMIMAILADWREGTSLNATANFNDPTDTTKVFALSGAGIPTGTSRSLDVEAVYQSLLRGAVPRVVTVYDTVGAHTHTFAASTVKFQIFAIGAGGGGGGVDGQGGGTQASASGGNSGSYGSTNILSIGSIDEGEIEIGTGGAGGAAGATAGALGGNTTWDDGTNSLIWPGGAGGVGVIAGANGVTASPVTNGAFTGAIRGTYRQGNAGQVSTGYATAVKGGDTPYGTGIYGLSQISAGTDGQAGSGFGSGGGGAAVGGVGTNFAGGAGRLGFMMVWEW